MDSMRLYQFEEEYDSSAVEADIAAFRRAKVAGIDSGHELHSYWLEPGVPIRRDGAAATVWWIRQSITRANRYC